MGAAGRFVAAATAFATMYGRKPSGAPFIPAQQSTDGTVNLTSDVAAELEDIIWSVVTSNAARTGVSPITVVISNRTSTAVALDAVAITPGNAAGNAAGNACGSSLAANAQCTVSVTFAPTEAGTNSGVLTITAAGLPYLVSLSGAATVTPAISANAASATVGQPLTLTWNSSPGTTCEAQSDNAGSPWTGSVPPSGTVAQNAPPKSGGGGAFDITSFLAVSGLLYRRRLRRASPAR